MPLGCTSVGRQSYVRIKLRQDTHALWVEFKTSLQLKSADVLACYNIIYLPPVETASSSRQDN